MRDARKTERWAGGRALAAILMTAALMVTVLGGMAGSAVAQDSNSFQKGVLIDPIHGATLVWPEGWSTQMGSGSDNVVADMQNQDGSILIHIEGYPLDGMAADQMAQTVQQNSISAMESIADGGQVQSTSVFPSGTNSWGFTVNNDQTTWLMQVSVASDPTKVLVASATVTTGADLGAAVAQVQGIMMNDAPLLQGFETVYPATTAAAEPAVSSEYGHGVLLDPIHGTNIVWPDGWKVELGPGGDDPTVATLTAEDGSVTINIAVFPTDGQTWDQLAEYDVNYFFTDQGEGATQNSVVTDSGYVATTDGQYGPRLLKGSALADPSSYLFVQATNIAPGTDLTALAERINAITINDAPLLQGIEEALQA